MIVGELCLDFQHVRFEQSKELIVAIPPRSNAEEELAFNRVVV